MNQEVNESLEHCDLILFVVDASQEPQEEDYLTANLLVKLNIGSKTLLLLNKIDLVANDRHESARSAYKSLLVEADPILISAIRPEQVRDLLDLIVKRLSPGPAYFPDDQLTDLYERDSAADLIREACLLHLRDEVPHGIAVRIDEYKERNEHGAYIAATLFVERESHKGIVIGQQGAMLKKIGTSARKEIEAATGRKVFLELRVKVYKNWRNDEGALRKLGFKQ